MGGDEERTAGPLTRRGLRRGIAVAAVGGAVLLGATPAGAHANLLSSAPPAGATLAASPPAVSLTFSERPEPALSSVEVLDRAGEVVSQGPARAAAGDPLILTVALPGLPEGVYTVSWRVVSGTDGHATAGSFAFGVGQPPGPVRPGTSGSMANPPPSPLELVSRWLFLVGLVASLGGSVAVLAVFSWFEPRVVRLIGAGALSSLAGLIGLALAQRASAGVGFATLAGTAVGRGLLWRGLAVADLLAAALIAWRGGARWWKAGAAAAGVSSVLGMVAEVLAGHAAGAESLRWAKELAQVVHFASAGVWVGGLAALLLGIWGAPSADKALAARRYSTIAAFALAGVVATGVVRAVNELGSWGPLFSSSYGRVVLVKAGLLLVLVALGATNRYRHVPAAAAGLTALRRTSRVELSVAAVVLAATALLTGLSPPAPGVRAERPAEAVVASGADFATTVRVRLEVVPGTAGPNRFRLVVTDYDTGSPVQAQLVSLRFRFRGSETIGSSTLQLRPVGDGVFAADGANLSLDGVWTVTVLIQQGSNSFEVPLVLGTACRARLLSTGPPAIYVTPLANGGTAQVYVDPGTPGFNEVHFTFFDPSGAELPVPSLPVISATGPGGAVAPLEVRRFSPGHFVAGGDLGPGRWRFDAAASAGTGVITACFEEMISR